jgi:tetratricopeptide (TPR) repeat protein
VALAIWLASAPTRAQEGAPPAPSGETPNDADERLRAALAAYELGDLAQARIRLEEVHALNPSARTLRGLGVVALRQGRHVEAVVLLERALSHPVKPLSPELAAGVRDLLGQALRQVARLDVSFEPADAELQVNAAPPTRDAAGSVLLAPGSYQLRISAPGFDPVQLVVLAQAGSRQRLHVPLPARAGAAAPSQALSAAKSAQTTSPRRASRRSALRGWGYGLLAGALAAGGTAAITTAIASVRINDIEERCRKRQGCDAAMLRSEEKSAGLSQLGRVVNTTLPLAGALGVSGGVCFGLSFRADRGAQVQAAAVTFNYRGMF